MTNPKRGEIWLVDLNPTRGQEIRQELLSGLTICVDYEAMP
ncbi:MAG: type II toxin-antitoxin system PemK/MazF family toxin [Phormidesmis sp. CAN_BIN36]|nr:type II toxin-antitoxin system PemK/MazF family toxin [Phormidesmis sp. CAN_BIN36]